MYSRKIAILLLFVGAVLVLPGPVYSSDKISALKLDLSAGYRSDELQWSIAGDINGANPNILSELTWSDLRIFQLQHRGSLETTNGHYSGISGQFSWLIGYGRIVTGDNQDSDYGGDNRTLEWSRSNNSADSGNVFDLALGVGLKFRVGDSFSILPRVGYSDHRQNLEMSDANRTLSDQATVDAIYGPGTITLPPLGPFPGLDSSYDAEWSGPWLGVRLDKQFANRATLSVGVEYHRADYDGKANWNLRSDLMHPVSFRHDGNGNGLVYELGLEIPFAAHWDMTVRGNYQNWQVDSGTDTAYMADGSVGQTRLQEVTWESYVLTVGVCYSF